jgi:hypothetical protein
VELHVLAPLDRDHELAVQRIAAVAQPATGAGRTMRRHLSLIRLTAPDRAPIEQAVRDVAARHQPLVVRARGYGIFCDDEVRGCDLHVPVVVGPALQSLHDDLAETVDRAGGEVSRWTAAEHWSPHISVVEGLSASELGARVAELARRRHPRWWIPLDVLQLVGPRGSCTASTEVPLGAPR